MKQNIHNKTPVFSDTEVLDLCDSIKDIHRVLKSIGHYMGNLTEATQDSPYSVREDFQRWGILHICETFLNDQFQKLERIVAIYKIELDTMREKRKLPPNKP
ncbi:MAG: hypothetical protein KKD44_17020 [Proteobacteria bacterium]|nr:hypothetical protein [Pseudomonadota bacterium]